MGYSVMKSFKKAVLLSLVTILSFGSPLSVAAAEANISTTAVNNGMQVVASGNKLYLRQNGKTVTSKSTRIVKVGDSRYIVNKKGRILTNFVKLKGTTYYANEKTGAIADTYVGLAAKKGSSDYYFVRKGVWDQKFTGIAKLGKTYYFVFNGVRFQQYTGLAKNAYNGKFYYVKDGVLDKSYTGVSGYWKNIKYYYVKNGKKNSSLTGLVQVYGPGTYLYMKKGVADPSFSGYVNYNKKSYFVWNGVVSSYANTKGLIANCGSDENGSYRGGKSGDQTGREWDVSRWANWQSCVLRHPDEKVRTLFAALAMEAASNDRIGYDQGQRWTFWQELQRSGYHPSKIKKNCETDCSAGVIAIVRAVGYLTGNNRLKFIGGTYTGDMRSAFRKAGFKVLTAQKYRTSTDYLKAGDILLEDSYHTAICVTGGSNAK